jgi:hypothetical protein
MVWLLIAGTVFFAGAISIPVWLFSTRPEATPVPVPESETEQRVTTAIHIGNATFFI